ncbi:hypothetical protein CAEBREN_18584 [Caenorhabditis brenneri]|uniref:Cyclin-like domain-containing protein n=1 Tax=Caenorhabditis brenneri TaxID=135651 RepID=G0P190_CAEBE|nr:hypothetical protein CAEBREN_18584 [Caenorhabditis brenneri]
MAGRKSARTSDRVTAQKERKSAILSPHDELRERLLETALDVKENIPERRVSSRNGSVGSHQSDCSESRKRQSTQRGPAAKRPSTEENSRENSFSDDRDAECSTSSSGSVSSRRRGKPLPVMLEEEEVFDESSSSSSSDHLAESEESNQIITINAQVIIDVDALHDDDDDMNDEEEEEGDLIEDEDSYEPGEDDEYEEEESEDDGQAPVQNESFAVTKRLMNDSHMINAPPLLTTAKCQGIGSPTKVWSLMVKRDDIPRATRFLLQNHPNMSVSMRRLLVDWMMEVSESEKFHRETFHLAVDYVDRYLESAQEQCSQDTFQLVGTAALFLAAKYEEIYPPKCADFASLTDGAFTSDHIRQMEILIVKDIGWSLGPITSIQWLSTYLQLLGTKEKNDDVNNLEEEGNLYVPELLRSEYIEMCKILDYLLLEIESFNFSYRTIAAAVLFVNYDPIEAVEKATGFSCEQLQKVIEYVRPVCRAFEKQRESLGDIIPNHEEIRAGDKHNIQVHLNSKEIEVLVERERNKDRRQRVSF